MPILGVHGAGSSAVFWEDAAKRLSDLGRAIIYDRRGSSRSERPEPYEITTVQEHADDARALRHSTPSRRLIGRSYGGTRPGSTSRCGIRSRVRGLAAPRGRPLDGTVATDDDGFGLRTREARCTRCSMTSICAVGEAVLRESVRGRSCRRHTARSSPLTARRILAEVRGGERTDNSLLGELRAPTLIVTARGLAGAGSSTGAKRWNAPSRGPGRPACQAVTRSIRPARTCSRSSRTSSPSLARP